MRCWSLIAVSALLCVSRISGAAGSEDEAVTAKILTKGNPPIEIANFAESGLTISNVKVSMDTQQISGASYTITNNSGKTLLAYVSSFSYYWDIAPDRPMKDVHSEDGWFINGRLLGPGEQDRAELTSGMHPNKPMSLLKVVVNVDYAEFADGSTWGSIDRQALQKFSGIRQQKLDVEHQYASLLKAGLAPSALYDELEVDLRGERANSYRRTALLQLQIALKGVGPERFVQRVLDAPASIPFHPGS